MKKGQKGAQVDATRHLKVPSNLSTFPLSLALSLSPVCEGNV